MKCPHCGTENEKNAIFCQSCNAWILGEVFEEAPTQAPQPEETAETKPASVKKRKWQLSVAAGLTVALIIGVILLWPEPSVTPNTTGPQLAPSPSLLPGPVNTRPSTEPPTTTSIPPLVTTPTEPLPIETMPPVIPPQTQPPIENFQIPNYIYSESAITTVVDSGNTHLIVNESVVLSGESWTLRGTLSKDLRGTAGAYLTYNYKLYYIRGMSAELIATNVVNCQLSADGNSLLYRIDGENLALYKWDEGTIYSISNSHSNNYCVSPNGDYVAFVTYEPLEGNKPYVLHIFTGAEHIQFRIFDSSVTLLGISDDGKTVYALGWQNRLMAVSDAGSITELGTYTSKDGSMLTLEKHLPILSSDHQQMLYYTSEGTFLSINGQAGVKISSRFLTPLAPEGANLLVTEDTITFPSDTLLGHVFSADSKPSVISSSPSNLKDLLYVDSDGNATLLKENVTEYRLTMGGTSLLYKTTGTLLHMDLLTGREQTISAIPSAYTFSRNGTYVYYMVGDMLMLTATEDTDFVAYIGKFIDPKLYVTQDDILCVWASNTLMVFDKFGTALHTIANVNSCELSSNGILYFTRPEGIYCFRDHAWLQTVLLYTLDTHPDEEIEPIAQEG